jgi:hypothetical protein
LDLAALFDLDDFALCALPFDFELFVDLLFPEEAFAFGVLPLFFDPRLAPPEDWAALFEDFLPPLFKPPAFVTALAFAETFLIAFLTFGAVEEREAAARPANAPITPPTTAPTGPATLPSTAPVAAPAVCFEMGGISMFSDDAPALFVDC